MSLPALATGKKTAVDFVRGMREYGFLYVKDHGVPRALTDRLLEQSRAFFELSQSEKDGIALRGAPSGYRGYQRTKVNITKGVKDNHEGIDFMQTMRASKPKYSFLERENLWPSENLLPEFQSTFLEYNKHMMRLGKEIMDTIVDGLEQDNAPVRLDKSLFSNPFWLSRAILYPAVKESASHEDSQGCGEHTDYGLLTMICQDTVPGCLHIRHKGKFQSVQPLDGHFVINIGDVLEFWTDGYFKATPHFVTSPTSGGGRISVPFFYEPNFDSVIRGDGTTYGDHLESKLSNNFVVPSNTPS